VTNVQGRPESGKEIKKRETRDVVRIVVALVILVLLIAFVLKNSQKVTVHFIFFSADVALIWVLLICILLGALVDRLLVWRQQKGRRDAAKKAR
jgi:uncharacterized integral membrane protein